MTALDVEIRSELEALSEMLHTRHMSIVDRLWSPGFRLVGSEIGEVVESREELEKLMTQLFGLPMRLRWVWGRVAVDSNGDTAWAFAEGNLERSLDDKIELKPYRLVAIFQKLDGGWKWRLFSGSEPY